MPCSRIERELPVAAPGRFGQRTLHGAGFPVGIENRAAIQVARSAADGLDQRTFRAQEAFLVGIENRHQRHLGHVEALAQQVDADDGVELAEPQIADDLHALDRLDVRVQIAHLHAVLLQVFGEILRHALGQRRDQHALAARRRRD